MITNLFRFLTQPGSQLLIFTLLFLLPEALTGQCLSPELAMINSCVEHPNPNGGSLLVESEFLVLRSGLVEIPVTEIGFDLPFNGFGPDNADLGRDFNGAFLGCDFKEPTVTMLSGCPGVIPLGPGGVIPPNAIIVVFITGTTVTADMLDTDFANICNSAQPVYILQSACERTSGAFANGPGAGDPLRTITAFSPCGLRSFTYNTQEINPNDGTYFLVGPSESGNLDCDLPVLPATCPPLDTTFSLCGYGALVDPPVSTDLFRQIYPNSILSISFHRSPGEAEVNTNQLTEYTGPTDRIDTLYTRIIYSNNLCVTVGRLFVNFPSTPNQAVLPAEPIRGCDPEGDGTGVFNLSLSDNEVGGGAPVTWYLDAAATSQINDITAFSTSATSVFAIAGLGNCAGTAVEIPLELIVGPTGMATITETSCPGNNDGAITLTAAGFGPFSYDWGNEAFNDLDVRTGLSPVQYRVTITDRYGCEDRLRPRVPEGDPLTISCAVEQAVTTPMADDGIARISFAGGNPPFQLSYSGAAAGTVVVNGAMFDLTGLSEGNYTFTAIDADGCTSEPCTLEIPASPPISLICRVRNNADGAGILGSINVNISGGISPFTITLTDAGGSTDFPGRQTGDHVFRNLAAGTYTFTVTGADGRSSSCMSTIVNTLCPLTIVDVTQLANDCSGTDNTVIRLTIAGNDGRITTVWSGPGDMTIYNDQQEAGPLMPGVYSVSISDQSGCLAESGPIVVTDPGDITFNIGGNFMTSPCQDDGSATIELLGGGSPPYEVVLIDLDTGAEIESFVNQPVGAMVTFDGLSGAFGAPNYAVFLADAILCYTDTIPVSITSPPDPDLTLPAVDQQMTLPTCDGGNDGSLTVMASGGTSPYNYRWIDYPEVTSGRILPAGNGQVDLPSGDYVIEIMDTNGCLDTAIVFLPDGSSPAINCGQTTSVMGATPGTAEFTLSGGAPPYTMTLTSNGLNQTYPGLLAGLTTIMDMAFGDYLAVVTDANGCQSPGCLTSIEQETCSISSVATIDSIYCGGSVPGRIALVPAGGTSPYIIDWQDPALPDQAMVDIAMPGNYPVRITDGMGCEYDTSFTVAVSFVVPTISFGPDRMLTACLPDSIGIPFSVSGAGAIVVSYAVSYNGQPPVPRTIAGAMANDTAWVTFNGTTGDNARVVFSTVADDNCSTASSETFDLEVLSPDTTSRFDVTCDPTPIEIGGRFFDPMSPSDTFLVADGSQCGRLFEVDITFQPIGTDPDIVQRFDVTCDPAPIEIGGRFFDPMSPSDTFLVVNDGSRCGTLYEVDITFQPIGTDPDIVRRFDVTCDPTPIEIGGRFFDPISPSDTFLVVDDGSRCGTLYEVDITFQSGTAPDTSIVFTCPATPYEENGEVFDANRPEGEVRYPRPGQCDSVVYVRLDIAPSFLGRYGESACVGDTIFYADTFFTAERAAGVARFPGMAANGCDSLVIVNNTFRRTGELRLFGDFDICPGDSVDLRFAYDGPGGINGILRDASGNTTALNNVRNGDRIRFFPDEPTTYTLVSSGIGGCPGEVSGSSTVEINDLAITTEVLVDPGDYCRDTLGRAVVNYTGGASPYGISWSNGPSDSLNRNLLAGTYVVTVSDGEGCVLVDSVMLNPRQPLTARVTGLPGECPGDGGRLQIDTIFGGGGFYEVSLDGEFFLPVENVADFIIPPGLRRATFQDADDCSVSVTFFVPGTLDPAFNLPLDTTIFIGDSVFLDPRVELPLDSAWWTPSNGLSTPNQLATVAAPLSSTNYVLHLRTTAQCEFTQTVSIEVDERLPVYAPTAFSPDGNGVNDVYQLEFNGRVREVRTFQIFNRWGTMLHDGPDGWDGYLDGQPAQVGVYVYQAILVLNDGSERLVKGDFVLMR
ncbi:T9SS type B sorting domain-containing protein [Neolewinella persica]|uniref:T9SS type B sorting domain-containing protein n=1 Tax=Neolewinella persica TaxID=70998 RepID=UPI0003A0301C|nr:gliding motility-associated C-terminal domain-containing protein [Neolewinella persica]